MWWAGRRRGREVEGRKEGAGRGKSGGKRGGKEERGKREGRGYGGGQLVRTIISPFPSPSYRTPAYPAPSYIPFPSYSPSLGARSVRAVAVGLTRQLECQQRTFLGPRELPSAEVAAATPASSARTPRRSIVPRGGSVRRCFLGWSSQGLWPAVCARRGRCRVCTCEPRVRTAGAACVGPWAVGGAPVARSGGPP